MPKKATKDSEGIVRRRNRRSEASTKSSIDALQAALGFKSGRKTGKGRDRQSTDTNNR